MKRLQHGFTLIELVVVISILAILAAVALPRFVDITSDARSAALQGVQGGFTAAVQLVHAKWLATGTGIAGTVPLEGTTVEVNAAGWPVIDPTFAVQDASDELYGIIMNAPLPGNWTATEVPAVGAGTGQFVLAGAGGGSFSYDAATGVVSNP